MKIAQRHQGLTLLEALITLSIVVILVMTAGPGLMDLISSNRAATGANNVLAAISFARSEAIKRGVQVSMCSSTDGNLCRTGADDNQWEGGWIVFTEVKGNVADGNIDKGTGSCAQTEDCILRVVDAVAGSTLRTTGFTGDNFIQFNARGTLIGSAGTFQLRKPGCKGAINRDIDISATGRPEVSKVSCS